MKNEKIIMFWSTPTTPNESINEWLNKSVTLSELHKLALDSHQKFEHDVRLYTYHKIETSLPPCVTVCDANDYYSQEDAYRAMQMGHSIAHISDLVRIGCAVDVNGVVLDLDAVVVNEFPDIEMFTSTMMAKQTGHLRIRWEKRHPPFVIHDGSWDGKALSVFPIKLHEKIRDDVDLLIEKISFSLANPPRAKSTKAWNYIMWTLKDWAKKHPDLKVMQPIHFCPIPGWKRKGNCYSLEAKSAFDGETVIFGNTMPKIDRLFEESYVIQHFFESSYRGSGLKASEFWAQLPKTSILYKEACYIWGENWQDRYFDMYNQEISKKKIQESSFNLDEW